MGIGPTNTSLIRPASVPGPSPLSGTSRTASKNAATAKVEDAFVAERSTRPMALTEGEGPVIHAERTPAMVKPLDLESEPVQALALKAAEAAPQKLKQLGKRASFALSSAETDGQGTTHIRLARLHNGIPVAGEQVIGHLDAKGEVSSVTGLVGKIPALLGSGKPKMTAEKAAKKLEEALGLPPGTVKPEWMTRTIAQGLDGTYRDTWSVEGFFAAARDGEQAGPRAARVDIESGKVESWANNLGIVDRRQVERAKKAIAEAKAAGTLLNPGESVGYFSPAAPEGNDQSNYSGKVEIGGTALPDGKQQMVDGTRGAGIETVNAEGRTQENAAPVDYIDDNGAWGEHSDPADQKSGVDAQYGAQMTYDFLRDILGRDSIDGQGEKLRSTVNVLLQDALGNVSPNAFWNGQEMTYGKGDGEVMSDPTAIDIAGHEIGHGFTQRTAGLIYRNESGGVNEAISDIIGAGVEWYAAQRNGQIDWNLQIGEKVYTPGVEGDALRDMTNPLSDGYSIDHYSLMSRYQPDDGVGGPDQEHDQGGVHGSSGIMNNAFALMAVGGQNATSGMTVEEGIGMESALKIFGRALQFYMTPNTTFAYAREATLLAAIDLFGADSKEVATVKQSWTAVGVGA